MKGIIWCFLVMSILGESIFEEDESPTSTRTNNVERIIGGFYTPIEDVAYMAAVLNYMNLLCGGSIVSVLYVISAAHCFNWLKTKEGIGVRVGSDYYSKGGEYRVVVEVLIHPRFNVATLDSDCAVLKVEKPFSKTFPYKELKLPTEGPRIGQSLLVSGWGDTRHNGTKSSFLLSVHVQVLSNDVCNQWYIIYFFQVPPTGFCAGDLRGGRDSCKGDSGGPAVRDDILVGIVSFGLTCGTHGVPGVYADVWQLGSWIAEEINGTKNES